MIRSPKQHGFALIIVIALLPLIGMVLYTLSSGLKSMSFSTTRLILEAESSNMTESAKAWSIQNIELLFAQPEAHAVQLQISNSQLNESDCSIKITSKTATALKLQIHTIRTHSNQKLKAQTTFTLLKNGTIKPSPDLNIKDKYPADLFEFTQPQDPYNFDPNTIPQAPADPNRAIEEPKVHQP